MNLLDVLLRGFVVFDRRVVNLPRNVTHHGIYNFLNAITVDVDEDGD